MGAGEDRANRLHGFTGGSHRLSVGIRADLGKSRRDRFCSILALSASSIFRDPARALKRQNAPFTLVRSRAVQAPWGVSSA